MAALLHSESKRMCSWWWDSHISPKNSKWLQENLTDMDAKVKAMIKLINEDADSFARRAEMYYKKRPELMKLVEEFYRAYRALAERYNQATGELRQAHRTMAEAFPDQVQFKLNDDTSSSSEPPSPLTSLQIRSFFDSDDLNKESDVGFGKKGLKQLNDMFLAVERITQDSRSADSDLKREAGSSLLCDDNQSPKATCYHASEIGGKAEADIYWLKEALAKVKAERDGILVQYKESLEKLCDLEEELGLAGKDAERLTDLVHESGCEVEELKELLRKVEAERDQNLDQYNESMKRVATLESALTTLQDDSSKLSSHASEAEAQSEALKEELSRAEVEKKAAFVQYEACLEKIFSLENKLLLSEENAKMLTVENERTQNQIKALQDDVSRLEKAKDDLYLRYQECLHTISELQRELRQAKEDVKRLSGEVLMGSAKLKCAEDQCASLQELNQSLKLEADDLVQRITAKDQQLSEKQDEFENLANRLHDERSRFLQVETALLSLQNLHFQSQEEQRTLALELRNGLQMLKDLEVCKRDLEEEIKDLREENHGLNDLKSASSVTQKNMEAEISNLREINAKLEAEVIRQAEKNDVLQQQVHRLKQEIEDLHKKYLAILQQIESSGIDPNCIGSSIMDLRAENSRLKQTSSAERLEKEALFKKLADMDLLLQRSATLESSLSDVNTELECSKENVKALQDSCSVLSGDRAALVGEKSALLSQLHMVTESMQKLLEKNASLETSLLSANTELEGLRVKSKSLEDFCKLLNDERSSLLTERSSLVSRLEYVEKKLENLETRFTKLEDKYAYLEKEKVSTLSQVEELKVSLVVERKERASLVLTSETRLSGLEDRVENLQQENKSRKKEFEEQVEKAVNAQVEIFIMQKFMQDMEQKNYSLLVECQKHAEAARYSEKIISELENENMMNQLETEFLLDRMAKLRSGVCQLLKAFEIDHLSDSEPENLLSVVLGNAKSVKRNLSKITDENHKLLVENNVLTALIQQLNLEGLKLASCKETLDQEFSLLNQKNVLLEQENSSLMAQSRQLDILVDEKERGQETLMAELGDLNTKQAELQREYAHLQEQHLSVTINSRHLEGKLMVLQQEKLMLEEENHSLTTEALSLSNQCEVFRVYGAEKAMELDGVAQDMRELLSAYQDLDNEADVFRKKLTEKEIENLLLKELILSSGEMNKKLSGCNDQLIRQLQSEKEIVGQKEAALLDAKLKIKATVDSNAEMHRAIEDLHKQCEGLEVTREGLEGQVLKLCDDKEHQGKEIGRLREDNERLESEIDELGAELEEYKIREVILSSELSERSSEFELWEAEATSFYFDLQISSLREVLLENKMNELTGLCEGLEDVNCEKSLEVERVNLQKSILQEEINKLKTQLDAYGPAVAFLKEHISSLERNPILQPSLSPDGSLEPEVEAFTLHDVEEIKSLGSPDRSLPAQDTLSALQELQGRIKTIESALVDGMLRVSKQEHMKSHSKVEAAMKQIEELRLKLHAQSDRTSCESERKTRTSHAKLSFDTSVHDQSSEIRNGADMKDIPLDHVSDSPLSSNRRRRSGRRDDQMLELWETEEQDSGCDSTPQQKQTQKNGLRRNGGMNYQLEIREDISSMGSSQMAKDLGVDTMVRTKTLTETKHGGNNKRVIVERLTSDAQMLMNLRMSVQDSRKKLETNRRSQKSSKAFEYERLRTQLEEVENSVNELVEMNAELVKTANANHKFLDADVASFHLLEAEQAQRKKLSELARRESERIGRLQLEMQRIQYVLLNMENEKRLNTADSSSSSTINQGKNRSRTGFILSKFIYNRGNRSPRKQKKPRFCGCFKHTRRGEP